MTIGSKSKSLLPGIGSVFTLIQNKDQVLDPCPTLEIVNIRSWQLKIARIAKQERGIYLFVKKTMSEAPCNIEMVFELQ